MHIYSYLLYLIFWLKLFIQQNFEIVFHNKVTTSLFKGKQKEIFFNLNLIINTFLSKTIKKHTNHIRQLCISKDRLISVKYQLNFTKVQH